jgi:aspartyl/asparaginyl beta-hydroxylase (cupin superfamily)
MRDRPAAAAARLGRLFHSYSAVYAHPGGIVHRPTIEEAADRAAAAGDFAAARSMLEQAVQSDGASAALWIKLAAVRNANGDVGEALAAVEKSLAISPLDFSALLYRATLLDKLGDPRAGLEFGHALAQLPPEEQIPAPMRAAVAHARKRWEAWQSELEAGLLSLLPGDLSGAEERRLQRFVSNRSRRTRRYHQEPAEYDFPELPEIEFHDRENFPELAELEAATDAIRSEFEQLIAAEAAEIVPYIQYRENLPLRQWKDLNQSEKWSAIHLYKNGELIERNARHCPETMAVLTKLPQPQVRGASPNAMFSLLAPRTRIPPHTGVANTRLVCHLPLIVPPDCGFRVGEARREWNPGEAFVFDDTIEHEAWNESDQLRVVFILDLWVPSLTARERAAITSVIESSGAGFTNA